MLTYFMSVASVEWSPILFDTPHNVARSVFTWIALLLLGCFLVAYYLLRKKPIWKTVRKYSLLAGTIYAAVVFITLLAYTMQEDGIVLILFVPILIMILLVAAITVMLLLFPGRRTNVIAGAGFLAGLLAVLVCVGVHFAGGKAAEINGLENSDVNSLLLFVFAAIGVGILFFVPFFFGKKNSGSFTTKSISYAAICTALSFALSFLTLFKMPQGGSITLVSLLPLMLYSQMFGVRKGVIVCFIYGILQAIQSPWILHPAQFLLDYPIAFGMIGLTSIFTQGGIKGKRGIFFFALGAVLAVTLRYLSHFVSGVFAFSVYAEYAGYQSAVIYSLAYNSFAFIDMGIALVVSILMLLNSAFLKVVNKVTFAALPIPSKTSELKDSEIESLNAD